MDVSFEIYNLTDHDRIPNSKFPVIVYHHVLNHVADVLDKRFAESGWSNAFRWRVYDYHHYHTNTHEILGVYAGTASFQLGEPTVEKLEMKVWDVIVIPAGTGHISLSCSADFAVVGAHQGEAEPGLIRLDDERP